MIGSHKIPEHHLKQFATGVTAKSAGLVWVYEKGRVPEQRSPAIEQKENGYFAKTLKSGDVDESMESLLANDIEGPWNSGLFRSLLNECFVPSYDERKKMARYIAVLFGRSEARQRASNKMQKEIAAAAGKLLERRDLIRNVAAAISLSARGPIPVGVVVQYFKTYSQPTRASLKNDFLNTLLPSAEVVADILVQKQWGILKTPRGCEFVFSDNPVMTRIPGPSGEHLLMWGFSYPKQQVFVPLNPHRCLVIGPREIRRTATSAEIDQLNTDLILFMERRVYSRGFSDKIANWVEEFGGATPYAEAISIPNFNLTPESLAEHFVNFALSN